MSIEYGDNFLEMNLENYDNIEMFVQDNFSIFESDRKSYTQKSQNEAFKITKRKKPQQLHKSSEISAVLEKIFSNIIETQRKEILSKYREARYNKESTYSTLSKTISNLSESKLFNFLSEEDKNIDIIFNDEHFSNPEKVVDEISDIDVFVANNIIAFNSQPSRFNKSTLQQIAKNKVSVGVQLHFKSDIDRHLKRRFYDMKDEQLEEIYKHYEQNNKASQTAHYFSEKYILNKNDILNFLTQRSFDNLSVSIADNENQIVEDLLKVFENNAELKNIKSELRRIIHRFLPLIVSNGFPDNITNVDSGIMVANAGDSAQFIFIARAILAGFDSSNVDVRSSRYDCIVDYKGKIYKVQVKGISNDTVYYKDRDRGGAGNDYRNHRNRGERITSKDCDIYAAVDKKTGIVYLIPINYLEENTQKNSDKINNIVQYREYWGIFEDLAHE